VGLPAGAYSDLSEEDWRAIYFINIIDRQVTKIMLTSKRNMKHLTPPFNHVRYVAEGRQEISLSLIGEVWFTP